MVWKIVLNITSRVLIVVKEINYIYNFVSYIMVYVVLI